MIKEIEVKTTKNVTYKEYWVVRGVVDENGYKTVLSEAEFCWEPTTQEILDFLLRNDAVTFATVEHNYRLVNESEETEE